MKARLRVVVAGAVAVLAGCAALPETGPVIRVDEAAEPLGSIVRYAPAPPTDGATPVEIVRGYLDAQLAYPLSSDPAAQYLTPDAADSWRPAAGVRVYAEPFVAAGPEVTDEDGGAAAVELRTMTLAELDATGHYRAGDGESVDLFSLRRLDGQWRIENPPDGTLVTDRYFDRYYRRVNAYYFDARGTQLLADPVHVPVGEQLPTALLASLTAGPPEALEPDARTYVPAQDLWRPSVTISEDGVAEVGFDVDVGAVRDGVRSRWSAQIVRTLAQVPGVEAVRIEGSDGPLAVGDSATQPVTARERFEPSESEGLPTAVVDGRVVTLDGGRLRSVDGPLAREAADVVLAAATTDSLAVARSGGVVQVETGGRTLDVPAEGVLALSWDSGGVLWLADAPGGRLRLRQVLGGMASDVAVPEIGAVTSFALDAGTRRWAATASAGPGREKVLVGQVQRDQRSRVVALRPPRTVGTDVAGAGSVVWAGPADLLVLGDAPTGRQVYAVPIDGSPALGGDADVAARLPVAGARRLAVTADSEPALYVTDDRDRLWHLRPGGAWRRLPPSIVMGLTSGR